MGFGWSEMNAVTKHGSQVSIMDGEIRLQGTQGQWRLTVRCKQKHTAIWTIVGHRWNRGVDRSNERARTLGGRPTSSCISRDRACLDISPFLSLSFSRLPPCQKPAMHPV